MIRRLTGVWAGSTNAQQWAVRDDYFWCRMIYKKGEQRERGFLTGYSKAVQLKAAMETFVNIHLKVRDLLSSVDSLRNMRGSVLGSTCALHRTCPFHCGKSRAGNQHTHDLTADPPAQTKRCHVVGCGCDRTPSWRRS
jgi:hypothetical protein